MSGIRTLTAFQDALDKEISWRIKEIGVFNIAARTNGSNRKAFIRAGVTLIYAHWEGFIKSASEIYLEYVSYRNLPYKDLKSCFCIFGLKGELELLSQSRKSVPNIAAFDFILGSLANPAKLNLATAVKTESNLSSTVFCNIASSLGIDTAPYDTKFHLIDKSLVERRNKIAHGQYLDLSGEEFSTLVEDVLIMLRNYKDDLQNAASLESYKR